MTGSTISSLPALRALVVILTFGAVGFAPSAVADRGQETMCIGRIANVVGVSPRAVSVTAVSQGSNGLSEISLQTPAGPAGCSIDKIYVVQGTRLPPGVRPPLTSADILRAQEAACAAKLSSLMNLQPGTAQPVSYEGSIFQQITVTVSTPSGNALCWVDPQAFVVYTRLPGS